MSVLRISGERFLVDDFLIGSALKPYGIFHIGEPIRTPKKELVHNHSGFVITVSDIDCDFAEQIEKSIAFLIQWKSELQRLSQFDGINDRCLDFGILWKQTYTHSDYLPPELLSLAGDLQIGIQLSHYPTSD